ncbi:hypothetical protein, partial [Modestobacter roseus]|uniref:hypothetical protein n=1 Tax=Modestobacter roseus TaxID=1181884 RepID=UPI001327C431
MSGLVSVQLEALGQLRVELAGLGRELAGDAELSGAVGRSLGSALPGAVGAAAASAGGRCAGLTGALAGRTAEVAAVLDAALTAYRAADAGLAGQLAALDPPRGPR